MKISTIMERIFSGRKVKFSEEEVLSGPYKGNKVIVIENTESEQKYVLFRSITNFVRFQRWIGKSARADVAPIPMKSFKVNSGTLQAVRISTVVELDKVKHDNNSDSEMDWDYDPEEQPDMRQGRAGTE